MLLSLPLSLMSQGAAALLSVQFTTAVLLWQRKENQACYAGTRQVSMMQSALSFFP